MKRGRMSNADKQKMVDLSRQGKTNAQIAKKLDRSEEFIAKNLAPSVVPAPEPTPEAPKPPTVGDIVLSPNRTKGVVVMSEAASQIADSVPKGGMNPRFTDCITKAQR